MKKSKTILFVNNEPLYIDNYLNVITTFFNKVRLRFITTSNCEQAKSNDTSVITIYKKYSIFTAIQKLNT